MKKVFYLIFGLLLLCGCSQEQTQSYFYEWDLDGRKSEYRVLFDREVKDSEPYSVYLNYLVSDTKKWRETIDILRKESVSSRYWANVSVWDEKGKEVYSVHQYPLRIHHHSQSDAIIALQIVPSYFTLEKGKKYSFEIIFNDMILRDYKKQIEVTSMYRAK